MAWGSWVALVGGVLSVISQWWGTDFYLAFIGGVVTIVGAIGCMSNN